MGTAVTDPMLIEQLNNMAVQQGSAPPPKKPEMTPTKPSPEPQRDEQPWWYPMASGAVGGRLSGLMPKVEAAGATLGSAMRGDNLPSSFVYDQAKQRAEMAAQTQEREQPGWTAAGEALGSLPGMLAAGGAINSGLKGLGSTGRFLAGSPDVPLVSRSATGQFAPIAGLDKAYAEGVKWLSQMGLGAREGAQAGALGAAQGGNDIREGALDGMTIGGALGGLARQVVEGLSRASELPRRALSELPGWVKGGVSMAGLGKVLEEAPSLLTAALGNPGPAMGVAATSATLAASRFLAEHPEMLALLTRMGVMGSAETNAALPTQSTPTNPK